MRLTGLVPRGVSQLFAELQEAMRSGTIRNNPRHPRANKCFFTTIGTVEHNRESQIDIHGLTKSSSYTNENVFLYKQDHFPI